MKHFDIILARPFSDFRYGISHILAHRTWAKFFIWLRSREEPGAFVVAFLSLGMGSIIVSFHPVWSGIPLILTLFGWSQVISLANFLR